MKHCCRHGGGNGLGLNSMPTSVERLGFLDTCYITKRCGCVELCCDFDIDFDGN